MPQSLAQLYTHLIFSTKNREPMIQSADCQDVQAYLGGALRSLECPSIVVGVVRDHVHLLYRHSRNLAIAKLVEQVKVQSSKWIKERGIAYRGFHWQSGYGAFSVSASKLSVVEAYVLRQEEHHRTVSFQEEYRRFLDEYGVEYDERYVWD